jgi:Ca-activated chloride channel family protein
MPAPNRLPMSYIRFLLSLVFILATLNPSLLKAQGDKQGGFINTRILLVFDASYSMSGYWESDQKINIARNFLYEIIDSLSELKNVQMALRVYGHQSPVPPQDCEDTKLEVPFSTNNALQIKQKLKYLTPKGTTPIAFSLGKAATDFTPCSECRNIIILITDGIEECKGDPCAVSRKLQNMGIVLKPFIIGIGIDPEFKKSFDCVGYFYNAANEKKFREVLKIVITQVLNTTTAQVNLLDINGRPTETDVNMTFYDAVSGVMKNNIIHTINFRGNPDTLYLDPLIIYRIVVHTLPPVIIDSVWVTAGKHTIISANAPQGYLELKSLGRIEFSNLQAIVRENGKMETLNYQKINEKEKYIVGKYDVEIPTLPRIMLEDVEILQSHTTTVEIPRPSIVTFLSPTSGFGSVYIDKENDVEWIINLKSNQKNQSLVMLPGNYVVVYRSRSAKSVMNTIIKEFSVSAGASIAINLD